MLRRSVLGGLASGGLIASAGLAGATFRWHATPQRAPLLTDDHLHALAATPLARPRVLFIGNSMVLRQALSARVARRAQNAGQTLHVAVAAANGARLVETARIDALEAVLAQGWDVLVLQDFSTMCLRAPDRWGSGWAMRNLAQRAKARAVLLYPTWAFPPDHHVYRTGGGRLSEVPQSPDAFAARITAHYGHIAAQQGWVRAPVTEALQDSPARWLAADRHHPNAEGAERIADVLWQSLKPLL